MAQAVTRLLLPYRWKGAPTLVLRCLLAQPVRGLSALGVSPRTGPVREAVPEAGEILGARVGDTCLGAQPITEQRPGGTDRITNIVAVMDIGEHGDDLQRFFVRQQHAGPRAWTLGRPQRQQSFLDERPLDNWICVQATAPP